MDLRETRRENLFALLAEEGGSRKRLAGRIKKSPSQLSQWLGRHRTVTEESAREIETNAGKPAGWLDRTRQEGTAEAHSEQRADPLGVPTATAALPVVLDALLAAPEPQREELAQVLGLFLRTGAPAYRQRLTELLTAPPAPWDGVERRSGLERRAAVRAMLEATPSTETADLISDKDKR